MAQYVLFGRTNVGKSSIFNKIIGKNIAIVKNDDNTTIDYLRFTVDDNVIIDTAGFNSIKDFNTPIGKVILDSDVILYVIDGRVGVTSVDREFIKELYKRRKTIYGVVNFSDCKITPIQGVFDQIFYVSGTHSVDLPFFQNPSMEIGNEYPIIALIGKTNVGKSTLMNRLVNQERSIVKDELGTTRDTVSEIKDNIRYLDTAGFSTANNLSYIIDLQRHRSLQYANGLVVVLDYGSPITDLDKQAINYGLNNNLFCIICFNKCDLEKTDHHSIDFLKIPSWIPIVYISAKNNNIKALKDKIKQCLAVKPRISKNLLRDIITENQLNFKTKSTGASNIKHIIQSCEKPIKISYHASRELTDSSAKHLLRLISERAKLTGHRIRLTFMKKHNKFITNKKK